MKQSKRRRLCRWMAASLIPALLMEMTAIAAAPTVDTDEAVYINLDYYGQPEETRIVKGVSLNGHTAFTDYGNYTTVYNMSTYDQPDLSTDGAVTWTLADPEKPRFYYECIPNESAAIELPWNFDVDYKLNGVPVEAEVCAGASGVVQMDIHAALNPNASDYYKNNMMLICGTGINMNDTLSIDAPGAQIQSFGTYKIIMFMGLPGEENDFTVRIGSNSFETMGLLLFMAPATLSSLDVLASVKDAKDRFSDSGDALYQGLSNMLTTMDSMKSGLDTMSNGIAGMNEARQQLIDSRDNVDPKLDDALAALDALTGQSDSLIPDLNQMQSTLTLLNASVNSMLNVFSKTDTDVTGYRTLLEEIDGDLEYLRETLFTVRQSTNGKYEDLYELADEFNELAPFFGTVHDDLTEIGERCQQLANELSNVTNLRAHVNENLEILGFYLPHVGKWLKDDLEPLFDDLEDIASAATFLLSAVKQLTGEESNLDELSTAAANVATGVADIAVALEEFRGVPEAFIDTGEGLTAQIDVTLDKVEDVSADIDRLVAGLPPISTALTQLNATTVTMLDKITEMLPYLTNALGTSSDALYEVRDTIRSLRDQADQSTQTSINGLLDVLDKAVRSNSSDALQEATDSIHEAIDDAESDLEDDTNVLNLDSSLALQSVTSDANPTPASVQFILRTKEISVEELEKETVEEPVEEDIGVWARITNIFTKLFNAVKDVFSSEE